MMLLRLPTRSLRSLSTHRSLKRGRHSYPLKPRPQHPRAPSICGINHFHPQPGRSFTTAAPDSRYTLGDKIGAAICVVVSGATFGLGVWQTKRYYWKVDRVAERRARVEVAPVALPVGEEAAGMQEELEYRRVVCEGVFEEGRDVLLGPRATPAHTGGLNQSGFFVFSPLRLDSGEEVVVNRGWVPKQAVVGGRLVASLEPPKGRTRVVGVVAKAESGGGFTPPNDLSQRKLLWLDFDALKQLCNAPSHAFVIDELAEAGQEQDVPVKKTLDNFMQFKVNPYTHIGYAATWYSLSAVALAFVRLRFLK